MKTKNCIPLLLASLFAAPAHAQEHTTPAPGDDSANARPLPNIVRASTLVGRDVENKTGRLGEIRDVYLGPDGHVLYYVLRTEGSRFTRTAHYAMPPTCLTPDAEGKRFVLDVETERFDQIDGFDPDEPWPAQATADWCDAATEKNLPRRPEQGAPVEADAPARPALAWNLDSLVGTSIENPAGVKLGRFAAVGLDLARARIAFWILSSDAGSDLIAVPWEALAIRRVEGEEAARLILDVTDSELEKAPEFDQDDEGAWRKACEGDWLKREYERFGLPFLLYYERNGLGGM